jgi:hypothetical protein
MVPKPSLNPTGNMLCGLPCTAMVLDERKLGVGIWLVDRLSRQVEGSEPGLLAHFRDRCLACRREQRRSLSRNSSGDARHRPSRLGSCLPARYPETARIRTGETCRPQQLRIAKRRRLSTTPGKDRLLRGLHANGRGERM